MVIEVNVKNVLKEFKKNINQHQILMKKEKNMIKKDMKNYKMKRLKE